MYLKQTADQIEQMTTALRHERPDKAARVAHSCAGASATCGVNVIVPLLRQIELLADEGKRAGGRAIVELGTLRIRSHQSLFREPAKVSRRRRGQPSIL